MRLPILGFIVSGVILAVISCCCLSGIIPQDIPSPTRSGEIATRTPHPEISQKPASQGEPTIYNSVTYDVVDRVQLINNGPATASVELKVALIRSISPYQEVLAMNSEQDYTPLNDSDGNQYANFIYQQIPAGQTREIVITYRVKVNGLSYDLGSCTGPVPGNFTDPEAYIESDAPPIVELANDLAAGQATVCDRTRVIYDYVGDNMVYGGYNAADWGAETALEKLTGDCTEYSDLTTALSRASGISARSIDGITCCTQNGYQEGQNKHNWLEAYLPGSGWVPLDPTWGRTPNLRDKYYAAITPDHIIVTQGRNPELLDGYHYFSYTYSWETESAEVVSQETWSILEAKSN
jgi:transglutaminase-like putative cysteine protease